MAKQFFPAAQANFTPHLDHPKPMGAVPMFEIAQPESYGAVLPPLHRVSSHFAAEPDRHDINTRLDALQAGMRRAKRAELYRNFGGLWPIALGAILSLYAPAIQDLLIAHAPWLAKFVFSLSVLASQCETHLCGMDNMPTISQIMLYAQLPLDGLLAFRLLKQRCHCSSVFGQVVLFHLFFLLCIGVQNGSWRGLLAS